LPPKKNWKLLNLAAKPLKFWGASPRRLRRRNAFELIQEYCTILKLSDYLSQMKGVGPALVSKLEKLI